MGAARPYALLLGGHLADHIVQPLVGRPDVDESRASQFDLLHERHGAERLHERLRDISRRAPGALRKRECDVRREIAVLLLARRLQLRVGKIAVQPEPGGRRAQPVGEPGPEFGLDHTPPSSSVRTVAIRSTVSKGFCT